MTEYKITNKNSHDLVRTIINSNQKTLFEFFGQDKAKQCEENYDKRLRDGFIGFLLAVLLSAVILGISGWLGFFKNTIYTLICVSICWLIVCFPMLSLFFAGMIDYFDDMVNNCHAEADLVYSQMNLDSMESHSVDQDANQYDIIHDYFVFGYLAGLDSELDEFLDKNAKFIQMNKQMARLRDLGESKADLYQRARGAYINALRQFRGDLFNVIKPRLNDCVDQIIKDGDTYLLPVDVKHQLANEYSTDLINRINDGKDD